MRFENDQRAINVFLGQRGKASNSHLCDFLCHRIQMFGNFYNFLFDKSYKISDKIFVDT